MEIHIKRLYKKYNDMPVLNINDLHFKKGKVTGVLGNNGSGKTTLLRIIAGIDNEFEGDILYGGSPYTAGIAKSMTMVFQKPLLLRGSVYKNIEYPLALRGISKAERKVRVDEIIERMELEHLAKKNAPTLSGGESQRAALARALVFRPEILLLDEPLSAIDAGSMEKIENIIEDYAKTENAAVIMVTHSISGAGRVCGESVFLKRERGGSIHEVFKGDEYWGSTQPD